MMSRWLLPACLIVSGAALAQGAPPAAPAEPDRSADCDSACLRGHADRYLQALAAHDPSTLEVAPTLRVSENSHAVALGDNVWKTIEKMRPEKVYFTDPYAGQVLVIGVLEMRAAEPFIYTVRLKLEKGRIAESETMVTSDKIAGQHFRPDLMPATASKLSAPLPAGERKTRAELLQAAQIVWGLAAGAPLTMAKDCLHYENWESPMGGSGCRTGTGRAPRSLRIPLVDVEQGVVVNYQLQDEADPTPRPPPPGEVGGKTPIFYYRPLTFSVLQLAKISGNQFLMDQVFMNLQEFGVPAVFRR